MSKITEARASTDPRAISPKVKAVGVWGTVAVVVLAVCAAFLQSIPREALEALGPWAAPVGAAIATLAGFAGAYAKLDPARLQSLLLTTEGGVYTSPDDPEVERFIRGEYGSNVVDPAAVQQRPAVAAATGYIDVSPAGGPGPDHLADESDETRAAESEAAAEELARALREQLPDEGEPRG